MRYKIEAFNREMDTYQIKAENGEGGVVTSAQVFSVMLHGYPFVNAELTSTGFKVFNGDKVEAVRLQIGRNTKAKLAEALRAQQSRQAPKPVQTVQQAQQTQKPAFKPNNAILKFKNGTAPKTSQGTKKAAPKKIITVIHNGKHYHSQMAICREYGVDVDKFMELYEKGYSVDECLGLKELRSDAELAEYKMKKYSAATSMARNRGDM